MRWSKAWLVLTFLAILGITPSGTMESAMAAQALSPAPVVQLAAATTQPSYPAGQPVTLVLTLTNRSSVAVGLSELTDANLHVVSFTRDGSPVPTSNVSVSYDDGLAAALSSSLTSVPGGGSLRLVWTSDPNTSMGGEVLKSVRPSLPKGIATLYGLGSPGTYSISVYYQYAGATGSFPGTVFTGKTNTATVTFVIR